MNYMQSAELEAFITHITLERRLAVNTVRNYRQAVVRFSGWLQQNFPESSSFKAAQPIHVRSYIVDLGRILARRTLHIHVSYIVDLGRILARRDAEREGRARNHPLVANAAG